MSKCVVFVSGVLAILLLVTPARATFNTSGHTGVVRTLSGKTYGRAKLNIGAGLHFGQDSKYLSNVVDLSNDSLIDPDPSRLLSSNVLFCLSPFSFLDFAANLPFYYDWSGIDDLNDGGLGGASAFGDVAFKAADEAQV